MIKRGFFLCFSLLSFALAITFFCFLRNIDVSLESVVSTNNPPVYLVSYADGDDVFLKNQNIQTFSAINRGIDFIHMYRRHHLEAQFVQENAFILSQKKGAGFWLWKPWVILDTLKKAPEGAIVIYADSGFVFTDFVQYFVDKLITDSKSMLFVAHDDLNTTVQRITQDITLKAMNCSEAQCVAAPHIWAGISVYKNDAHARSFVETWLQWCKVPRVIMDDEKNGTKRSNFIHHHHDESVLSILCHQKPEHLNIISLSELHQQKIVRWHHRHPKGAHISLLPHVRKSIRKWTRFCYQLGRNIFS